ncbi:MAG: S-methyl-5-thioribose-1-phosphate isomerase [Coriobacteriales bacterium]|jgi:methylthioribose-1-phosphate isomerase|nr:S-methyl-5-thioribose-1-phosphate isomerase [Coriobacteriales bacterium]
MKQLDLSNLPRTIWWEVDASDGIPGVYLIDQTRLPLQGDVLCCRTLEGVEMAVKTLALRGAPALGVGAAMAMALYSENESTATTTEDWLQGIDKAAERIGAARPTAVNLAWGAQRARDHAHEVVAAGSPLAEAKEALVAFAQQMAATDEATNRAIGANGAALIAPKSRVLTHCNAGSLGTAYFGTALGVIYTAFEQGKLEHVWVDETRPLGQGARLTAWELMRVGVPCVLIADSMAASVMAQGWVDAVLVGADRICANGDTANKIGTLGLALLARHYAIPFYVCAPTSTIDRTLKDGSLIPIEQRDPRELTGFTASGIITPNDALATQAFDILTAQGAHDITFKTGHQMTVERKGGAYRFDAWFQTTPPQIQVYNPAFDVTPANLITSIITEHGVYKPDNL